MQQQQEEQQQQPLLHPPLTVATYNIHSCVGSDNVYSVERIAAVIKTLDVDIIALQEVEINSTPQKTRLWSSTHNDDQVSMLADLTDMPFHAFAKSVDSVCETKFREAHDTASSRGGRFGIAVLSRHPILEESVLMYKRYRSKTQRNALAVRITPGNLPLWFVCTHLGCHTGSEQNQQALELSEWTNSSRFTDHDSSGGAGTIIVTGDCNAPPWFRAAGSLRRNGFRDCRGGRTFPALGWPCCFWMTCCPPLLKLDYCLYRSEDYRCGDGGAEVMGDKSLLVASDHRPLRVEFVSTVPVLDGVVEESDTAE